MRLLALILTIAPVLALAQPLNPCGVPAPTEPWYYTDIGASSVGKFQCMPAPGGTGAGLKIRSNLAGAMAYWYCPDNPTAPTKWTANFAAATWTRLLSGNLTPDTPLSDPSLTPVWCPFQAEMIAGKPAVGPGPAPGTWITAETSTFNRRADRLGLASFAGVGATGRTCDCRTANRIRVGPATYCPVEGGDLKIVAKCVQVLAPAPAASAP